MSVLDTIEKNPGYVGILLLFVVSYYKCYSNDVAKGEERGH